MNTDEIQAAARRAAYEWWFAPDAPARQLAACVLADLGEEFGRFDWPVLARLRAEADVRTVLLLLRQLGGWHGLSYLSNKINARLALATAELHARRDQRIPPGPEGYFDAERIWWPEDREDAGDVCHRFAAHLPAYRLRYFRSCCTRRHCRRLVERVSLGFDAPVDAVEASGGLRCGLYLLFTGEYPTSALARHHRWSPLLPYDRCEVEE